jgi:hexosaminidase
LFQILQVLRVIYTNLMKQITSMLYIHPSVLKINLSQKISKIVIFSVAILFICCSNVFCISDPEAPFLTPLRARGFSLIPAPQQVELGVRDVVIDGSWIVVSKINTEDIAVKRLISGSEELHGLTFSNKGTKKVILAVTPGIVKGTDDSALNEQGYLLKVTTESVEITGNSNTGLYYGVQSLLQLMRRNNAGRLVLPECLIHDWPSLQLRFVHWDTKHHQKRIETMKRLIDWHAFFKVNMIALEIEDKYEYPRHPVIGVPGAYTKAEMQELTRYALERHIQIVPDVQAPAHMSYVLKHKEFAHLKADPASNYQACMCDPEAINLIFDMYQDMIDATPGVDYFLVSTDEVYYAGICDKCKRPYNPENRSLAWAEFAVTAHDWLSKRGRRMIAWVEYPLQSKEIALLPPDLINGVMGNNRSFIEMQNKVGIRQLAYSSIQGSERLFSNYFSKNYVSISGTVREGIAAGAHPIGSFAAAWDDSGLHEEVFHLGWATVTQYAWNPYGPAIEQTVADFMDIFYGQSSPDMTSIYKLLIEGAKFYGSGWDQITSLERGPGYGNSDGKAMGTRRTDDILGLPEIPGDITLNVRSVFSEKYSDLIMRAENLKVKNDDLVNRLTGYISKVERNRYNLEVYLSIAYLERYFINTVITLRDAETLMFRAQSAAAENRHADAVANLVEASNMVGSLIDWSNWMWRNLTVTWQKSRYEKGRSAGGRDFVHVLDDVKDHQADRRKGLDYLIAPFQRMNLPDWRSRLNGRINMYASVHNVQVRGLEEARLED